jgi:hypothetical protein
MKNVTLMMFITADNTLLMAVSIWPAAEIPKELTSLESPTFHLVANKGGWVTKLTLHFIFVHFLFRAIRHRRKFLRLDPDAPALLLFDSHSSRNQRKLWAVASKKHIVGLSLVPHMSGHTQPLDVKPHGVLKSSLPKKFKMPALLTAESYRSALVRATGDAVKLATLSDHVETGFSDAGVLPGQFENLLRRIPVECPYPQVLASRKPGPKFDIGAKVLTAPDVQAAWSAFDEAKLAANRRPGVRPKADAVRAVKVIECDDSSSSSEKVEDCLPDEEDTAAAESSSAGEEDTHIFLEDTLAPPTPKQSGKKPRETTWATMICEAKGWAAADRVAAKSDTPQPSTANTPLQLLGTPLHSGLLTPPHPVLLSAASPPGATDTPLPQPNGLAHPFLTPSSPPGAAAPPAAAYPQFQASLPATSSFTVTATPLQPASCGPPSHCCCRQSCSASCSPSCRIDLRVSPSDRSNIPLSPSICNCTRGFFCS